MKRRNAALFGAVVVLLLSMAAGCSSPAASHSHDHSDDQAKEAARTYLTENYPTRDQMLRVQQCVTERTGHEFPELPADFGPEYLTKERPADDPRPPNEVYEAHHDCAFHLGLEDRFFPPWDHDYLRPDDA